MKLVIVFVVLSCVVMGYFFIKGLHSRSQVSVDLSGNVLPGCGAKPNCVSSRQSPSDAHYVEAIDPDGHNLDEVVAAIESIGGVVSHNNGVTIQATFSSGIFRFVDDLAVQHSEGRFEVRSASRVGYSDLGANRQRIERLRKALSSQP